MRTRESRERWERSPNNYQDWRGAVKGDVKMMRVAGLVTWRVMVNLLIGVGEEVEGGFTTTYRSGDEYCAWW